MIAIWTKPIKAGSHLPVVVLLHGRGADEHDLTPVAARLPRGYAGVSVRGLVELPEGGYTWFENRGIARPIGQSLRASVSRLAAWIDEIAPQPRPVYVLGFSAGMMMAGALILTAPQRFAGAVLLSGALPLESGLPVEPDRLRGLPVFLARGTADDVIPGQLVAASQIYLCERSGAAVTLREYAHGHTIALREIQDIARWLSDSAP